jgi:hypothetical protein
MSLSIRFVGFTLAVGCFCLPRLVAAQGGPLGDEGRTWFSLSGAATSWSTTTRDDGGFINSPGTQINAEDELNIQRRKPAFGLAFGRRIGENWRIELDWTTVSRSGNSVLTRDIRVNGDVFTNGSQLRTTVNVSGLRINGGWSLARSDAMEWGVSFGGQWITTTQSFERTISGGGNATVVRSSSGGNVALLPVLGLFGTWAVSPALQMTGRAEVGVLGGSYGQLNLAGLWRATPNLGVGLGLRHVQGRLNENGRALGGGTPWLLDFRSTGPQLLLNLSF